MQVVFSDQFEDALKAEFFAPLRTGYFAEVGANDPKQGSQTWQLEQWGWDGVLIEPQPDLAVCLRRSRRAHVVAAACSGPERAEGRARLYVAGPHSSLSPNLVAAGASPNYIIEVPARTLDDVLYECGAPTPLDFVSIDVEGHELAVLQGFELGHWKPRLILVEDHVTSLSLHRYLTRRGYRLIRRTGLNGWYVPNAAAPSLGWGVLQIVRKYYLSLPFRWLRDRKRQLLIRFVD